MLKLLKKRRLFRGGKRGGEGKESWIDDNNKNDLSHLTVVERNKTIQENEIQVMQELSDVLQEPQLSAQMDDNHFTKGGNINRQQRSNTLPNDTLDNLRQQSRSVVSYYSSVDDDGVSSSVSSSYFNDTTTYDNLKIQGPKIVGDIPPQAAKYEKVRRKSFDEASTFSGSGNNDYCAGFDTVLRNTVADRMIRQLENGASFPKCNDNDTSLLLKNGPVNKMPMHPLPRKEEQVEIHQRQSIPVVTFAKMDAIQEGPVVENEYDVIVPDIDTSKNRNINDAYQPSNTEVKSFFSTIKKNSAAVFKRGNKNPLPTTYTANDRTKFLQTPHEEQPVNVTYLNEERDSYDPIMMIRRQDDTDAQRDDAMNRIPHGNDNWHIENFGSQKSKAQLREESRILKLNQHWNTLVKQSPDNSFPQNQEPAVAQLPQRRKMPTSNVYSDSAPVQQRAVSQNPTNYQYQQYPQDWNDRKLQQIKESRNLFQNPARQQPSRPYEQPDDPQILTSHGWRTSPVPFVYTEGNPDMEIVKPKQRGRTAATSSLSQTSSSAYNDNTSLRAESWEVADSGLKFVSALKVSPSKLVSTSAAGIVSAVASFGPKDNIINCETSPKRFPTMLQRKETPTIASATKLDAERVNQHSTFRFDEVLYSIQDILMPQCCNSLCEPTFPKATSLRHRASPTRKTYQPPDGLSSIGGYYQTPPPEFANQGSPRQNRPKSLSPPSSPKNVNSTAMKRTPKSILKGTKEKGNSQYVERVPSNQSSMPQLVPSRSGNEQETIENAQSQDMISQRVLPDLQQRNTSDRAMKEPTDNTLFEIDGIEQEVENPGVAESHVTTNSTVTKSDRQQAPSLTSKKSESISSRSNEFQTSSSKGEVNENSVVELENGSSYQPTTSTKIEVDDDTDAIGVSNPPDDADDENESLASKFFAMMLNEAQKLEDTVTTSLMSPTRRVDEQVSDEIGDIIVISTNPDLIQDEIVEIQINEKRQNIVEKTDNDDLEEGVDLISAARSKSDSSTQLGNESGNLIASPSPIELVNSENLGQIELHQSESTSLISRMVVDGVEASRKTSISPSFIRTSSEARLQGSAIGAQSVNTDIQAKRNSITSRSGQISVRSGQISLRSFANSRQSKTSNRSLAMIGKNGNNNRGPETTSSTIDFPSAISVQSNLSEHGETKWRSQNMRADQRDSSDTTRNDDSKSNVSKRMTKSADNDILPLMSDQNAASSLASPLPTNQPSSCVGPRLTNSSQSSMAVSVKTTDSVFNIANSAIPINVDLSIGLPPTSRQVQENAAKHRSKSMGPSVRETSNVTSSRLSTRSSSPSFRFQNNLDDLQSPKVKRQDSMFSDDANRIPNEPNVIKSSNVSTTIGSVSSGKSNRSLGGLLKQTLKSKLWSQQDELQESNDDMPKADGVNGNKTEDFDWKRNSITKRKTDRRDESMSDHQSESNFSEHSTSKFWEEAKQSQNDMGKSLKRVQRPADGTRSYSLDPKHIERHHQSAFSVDQPENMRSATIARDYCEKKNSIVATEARNNSSIQELSIVRRARSASLKREGDQTSLLDSYGANPYSGGVSEGSKSSIQSLRQRLNGVDVGNELRHDELDFNQGFSSNAGSNNTSVASNTKSKQTGSDQGSATQSTRYMQTKTNMIPIGLRAKSVPKSQFLKSKEEAQISHAGKAWGRARSLSLQRSPAPGVYQAKVPLTFTMNASDYDGSTLTSRGYESKSSQRSEGDKDVSTLTEENSSVGDPWEDITGASRIIVDAINRIERVASEDTDYESTADQVEQALETLESYAASLGIKERELLLLAINNERDNETDSADARNAFASDLLNFIRQNTDSRSLQLQLMGSSEFSVGERSQT